MGGWGSRIKMSINIAAKRQEPLNEGARKEHTTENMVPKDKCTTKNKDDFGKKMFEFLEASVDEDVEEGLFQSMVGISWMEETPESLQGKLSKAGLSFITVVDESNAVVNPMICLATTNYEAIIDEIKILVKGVQHTIIFKEVIDIKSFIENKKKSSEFPNSVSENERENYSVRDLKDSLKSNVNILTDQFASVPASKDEHSQVRQTTKNSVFLDNNTPSLQEIVPETQSGNSPNSGTITSKVQAASVDNRMIPRGEDTTHSCDTVVTLSEGLSISLTNDGNSTNSALSKEVSKETKAQSQNTLCIKVDKLNMGRSRGRPKKKAPTFKNPFDFGHLGGKPLKGNFKKRSKKRKISPTLESIQEEIVHHTPDEADMILESAQLMGLAFPLGQEESKKIIEKRLQEGNL
ncbi:hypothetical protein POM88_040759 [Heracleum sosnowskyi]|uniref:Uncharacterized protein n=1 Tax=Heracleum sosnowskyi TaxID=360622 RepID=A0AAD8HEM5_9APIA|nr:hypothetical protein POM88_040759 [Heracleum sosnowskyi]